MGVCTFQGDGLILTLCTLEGSGTGTYLLSGILGHLPLGRAAHDSHFLDKRLYFRNLESQRAFRGIKSQNKGMGCKRRG